MADYYLDTSAVVKRYADEPDSNWVRQITDPNAPHTILLAEITLAEVAAALSAIVVDYIIARPDPVPLAISAGVPPCR